MLIGILGNKGSGKDTIADYLVKKYNYSKISISDPLKKVCMELFQFTDDQLYINKEEIDLRWNITPRAILQYLGTDIFRNDIQRIIPDIKEDFWIQIAIDKYKHIISTNHLQNVVIADVRFQNEIECIRGTNTIRNSTISNSISIIIKVIRPDLKMEDNYVSESNIKNLKGDYEIVNNGTIEDLYLKIDSLLSNIH